MEVLRHGNTYKEVECTKCGALLSYCKTDIKSFDFTHKHVICPECNAMVGLKNNCIIERKE